MMATEVKPTLPTRLNVGNSPMSAEFLYDGGPEWIAEVSYGRQTAELAAEIARRWNQHPDLLAKCERPWDGRNVPRSRTKRPKEPAGTKSSTIPDGLPISSRST